MYDDVSPCRGTRTGKAAAATHVTSSTEASATKMITTTPSDTLSADSFATRVSDSVTIALNHAASTA